MHFFSKVLKRIKVLFYKSLATLKVKLLIFSKPQKKLLILKIDSIGDYILFRNFILEVKTATKYKDYHITLCGNMWWRELAEKLDANAVDHFIWIDYFKLENWSYKYAIAQQILKNNFETILHPTYSRDLYSDELVKYSGVKNCIGYNGDYLNTPKNIRDKFDVYYSRLIDGDKGIVFEFYRNKYFFESVLEKKLDGIKPFIPAPASNEHSIIICPGAKDVARQWGTLKFIDLIQYIHNKEPQTPILLCGSKSEESIGMEINKALDNTLENIIGKVTLGELIDVFASAKLIVTNDSGPFHLAVALNKKVICISNGTNFMRFSPYPKELNTTSKVIYAVEGQIAEISKVEVSSVLNAIYND